MPAEPRLAPEKEKAPVTSVSGGLFLEPRVLGGLETHLVPFGYNSPLTASVWKWQQM